MINAQEGSLSERGSDVYATQSRLGRQEYFFAPSLGAAHSRAAELVGPKYRFVCLLRPGSPQHRKAEAALGLV